MPTSDSPSQEIKSQATSGLAELQPRLKSLEAFHAREFLNNALMQAASIDSAIPDGFNNWDLKVFPPGDADGWETVAHIHATVHVFPGDFPWWNEPDSSGFSVAHVAAIEGTLPDDFAQWEIQGPDGFSVGHALVAAGNRHDAFTGWNLQDASGVTPAHIAASTGMTFPENFHGWHLTDNANQSVLEVMQATNHPDLKRIHSQDGCRPELPGEEEPSMDETLVVVDDNPSGGPSL